MHKPVDALVTGFTRSPDLLARSLAPLRRLKHEGVLRNIHCVTWDSAEIDACVAPLRDLPEIQLTRVPQPGARGTANQRGVVYQVENLRAALAQVPDDPLILKWRPDFVARHGFLREKIVTFAQNAVVPPRVCFGITMPPPVFRTRLWIAWADSNSPFFYEDAVFLGERREVEMLTALPTPAEMEVLGDPHCGSYAHVVRYAKPFIAAYPLFANYMRRFRYFRHDMHYRAGQLSFALNDAFFWHMIVAHAWILHTQFYVDIGAPGDLRFYANAVNRDADWSRFETLRCTSPYDDIASWRLGTRAGEAFPGLSRAFGRLMDDAWHKALFTAELADLPRQTLTGLMANVAACADGRLGDLEAEFYRNMGRIHRDYRPALAG